MHKVDVLIGKKIIGASLGVYDEKLELIFEDGSHLTVKPGRALIGNNDSQPSLNLTLKPADERLP